MVRYGESPGTSTASGSLISCASGVASWRLYSLAKEYVDPTTPRPTVIMVCSSPARPTSEVMAPAPPAPITLSTVNEPPVMSASSITATAARPVWS